jgi:proteic killer suppression protein
LPELQAVVEVECGRIPWVTDVIRSFRNGATEDVFNDRRSRGARLICPSTVWQVARRKLMILDSVTELRHLALPPANRLEALKGDRRGQHSIRINDQYQLVFTWTETGPDNVEIVDYH